MSHFKPKAVRVREESISLIMDHWPDYTEEAIRTDLMKGINYVFVKDVEIPWGIANMCIISEKTFNRFFKFKDEGTDYVLREISYL